MQPTSPQPEPSPFKLENATNVLIDKIILSNRILFSIPFIFLLLALPLALINPWFLIMCIMLAIFSGFFVYIKVSSDQEKFTLKFRETVVQNLIHTKDASINYEPKSYFTAKELLSSGLLERIPNVYEGENYLEQKNPHYTLEVAWAYALKQQLSNSMGTSMGNRNARIQTSHSETMLNGLVYKFTLPKRFKTNVIIHQDRSRGFLNFSNENPDVLYGQFGHIKIDDEAFEKEFEVYALDENEGKKMMDKRMIGFLLYLKNHYNRKIQVSFLGNYIYMTIQTEKKYFYPGFILSKNSTSINLMLNDAQQIFFIPDIMQELLMEWSKGNNV